jgi:VWFA-related protein
MQVRDSGRVLGLTVSALGFAFGAGTHAQNPPPASTPPPAAPAPGAPAPGAQDPQRDVFRSRVDVVTTDVIVRDSQGQFIPDLKKEEFNVFEDGVKQDVISFTLVHGGRTTNLAAPPPPPVQEGIILPPSRPTSDASGRVFLIFVDDLHLDFRNTGRIRELFKKIAKELIHEGDMFGIVSTGPSSLAIDMTYDRKRLDQAIDKISGAGLSPKDILETPDGSQGPAEVRYRAHVAFSTAYDIMGNLEQVHNRRKAFIYVSNGYDFNPFAAGRERAAAERLGMSCDRSVPGQANCSYPSSDSGDGSSSSSNSSDPNPFAKQGNEFADADLASELGYLTRAANRANATIYTIDPRGLVGGPDIDQEVDMMDWQNYVTESQNSLRVLAELTGGYAAINQNDFTKALKRIDAETSDYYVIGYYSSNPDPMKKRRRIDVNVTRSNVSVLHRTEYTLKAPPVPRPAPAKITKPTDKDKKGGGGE